jgi:hypothetical protein
MKRHVPGLSDTARDSQSEVPDGVFLVRLDGGQHRWQSQKRFYLLRLSILEPKPFAGRSIVSRLLLHAEGDVEAGLVPAGFSL